MTQKIAVCEPAVPVHGESTMTGNRAAQIQAAEPTGSQVQMNLFAQPPLEPNADAVTNRQNADHQSWIN